MPCQHNLAVKDAFSDKDSFKISLCTLCHEVIKVVPRGEKPPEKSVWDVKDLRITRMSVIKSATDLSMGANDYSLANVLEIAEAMEKWVYRKE